jgi:peptide/nickel transport system permease protein
VSTVADIDTVPGRGPVVTALVQVGRVLREVARRPGGLFGLIVVVGLLVVVVAAPLVAPYSATQQDIANRLAGPSLHHLLGTDELGRDLLSRVIYGARIAMAVAVPAVLLAMAAGLIIGLIAGYFGGGTDQVAIVGMDAVQAFPAVILALALLAVLGPSLRNVVIVIAVALAPGYARVVRAMTLAAKQNQYVEAELSLGVSTTRLTAYHLLPNIAPPLFILIAMDMPSAIAIEAGLAFLGLGVPPPSPDWGALLADGFTYVLISPWAILAASLALIVVTVGFTMLGEALRDVLDPKLSGVRGVSRLMPRAR